MLPHFSCAEYLADQSPLLQHAVSAPSFEDPFL